jgi:DNA-binding transcriptional MerR regulator
MSKQKPLLEFNQKKEAHLYIGKVAEITGATRKAIRHYESLGLIPTPERKGKYRVYSEQDIFLIHLIKQGQTIGFTLNELKGLLAEQVNTKRFPLKIANQLMEEKRLEIYSKINKLQYLENELDKMKIEMNELFHSE